MSKIGLSYATLKMPKSEFENQEAKRLELWWGYKRLPADKWMSLWPIILVSKENFEDIVKINLYRFVSCHYYGWWGACQRAMSTGAYPKNDGTTSVQIPLTKDGKAEYIITIMWQTGLGSLLESDDFSLGIGISRLLMTLNSQFFVVYKDAGWLQGMVLLLPASMFQVKEPTMMSILLAGACIKQIHQHSSTGNSLSGNLRRKEKTELGWEGPREGAGKMDVWVWKEGMPYENSVHFIYPEGSSFSYHTLEYSLFSLCGGSMGQSFGALRKIINFDGAFLQVGKSCLMILWDDSSI